MENETNPKNGKPRKPKSPPVPAEARPRKPPRHGSEVDFPDISKIQRTREERREGLKQKVRMFYDLQMMRMQADGRTKPRASGQILHLHEADKKILEIRAFELERAESNALKDVEDELELHSFYNKVLSDKEKFRGIGPTMAGVILSEFDIFREDTVGKMWAFAGLAPKANWRCKSCHSPARVTEDGGGFIHLARKVRVPKPGENEKPEVMRKCEYAKGTLRPDQVFPSGESAKPVKGEKLPYNDFLRAKMCGVLGSVLLRLESPWRKHYDDYKLRKQQQNWGQSDKHRHNAATRYMIKQLLLEIWRQWRAHEGLSVRSTWQEERLGHKHVGGSDKWGPMDKGHEAGLSPAVIEELKQIHGYRPPLERREAE
jgi:hypothetical protein